jgi:hypothetical protein
LKTGSEEVIFLFALVSAMLLYCEARRLKDYSSSSKSGGSGNGTL